MGDGRIRSVVTHSKLSLGQSLLLLPFAGVGLAAGALLPPAFAFLQQMILNALPALESAAICALLFLLVRILGNARPELSLSISSAAIFAFLSGVATQLWPASRTLFADNSTAFLLMFSIYALVRFARAGGGEGWLIAAGWSAALMVLCKNVFILACPAIFAYGYWALYQRAKNGPVKSGYERLRIIIFTLFPFLLAAGLQFWYNELRYGSIWSSGYHDGRDGDLGFSTPLLTGLYGIFLSSGRSVFLYSPLCILAFFGAGQFARRLPAETALIASASIPVVFAYAKWWSWHGGWEWGARFYLFMVPLLLLLSVPAWKWLDQSLSTHAAKARMAALAVLVAGSVGVQTLGLMIHPAAYWFLYVKEVAPFAHPVYQKGVWELKNDTLLPHFVPEFSPVAAHAWLTWATWRSRSLDDAALASAAPWSSLNPQWAPKNVRPYLGFDLWFLGNWPAGPIAAVFLVLLAALIACGLRLRAQLWRARSPGGFT